MEYKHVLIVDDEKENRDDVEIIIKSIIKDSYCSHAKNVKECKEYLDTVKYDLLVIDNYMPINSSYSRNHGLDFIKEIRNEKKYSNMKIILYSASYFTEKGIEEDLGIKIIDKNLFELKNYLKKLKQNEDVLDLTENKKENKLETKLSYQTQ
jgi:response regulator of citrate/malate metabolism